MRTVTICGALALTMPMADAQNIAFPEVVRLENVRAEGDMKIVTVGNVQRHYSLFCKVEAIDCITPERGKNYLLLFDNRTSEMATAKEFIASPAVRALIATIQKERQNIVLVPEEGGSPSDRGMFLLDAGGRAVHVD